MSKKPMSLPMVMFAAAATATMPAAAQEGKIDLGKAEYTMNCAHCHGATGKGDGPTAEFLTPRPADLTGLAKANDGILPVVRIYDTISGKARTRGHGTLEMPAFGTLYGMKAAEYYVDVPYDSEAFARARILVLMEYINRLQEK